MEGKIDQLNNNNSTELVENDINNENNTKSKTKSTIDYTLIILSGYLKGLLIPAYKSTDFEVHRNWLAITNSLPLKEWYYENTSEWTLDYPPFFAWFEYFMSLFAKIFDKDMLNIHNLNYSSFNTILYQRGTVMITEWVLFAALMRLRKLNLFSGTGLLCYLLFLHPSLFTVDHMHFQYNGFMFGILMWSLILAYEGKNLLSGILFAILLNFKHIYLYIAPAYFVYLLRGYCFASDDRLTWVKSFKRLFTLGASVILVFLISFGPFIYYNQLPQVISRLFPFKRGLCHAYWAPNFWALYSFLDRVLIALGKRLFPSYLTHLVDTNLSSATRGLIGDSQFFILPNILPIHTLILTVVFQLPCLIKLWKQPNKANFIDSVVLCGYSSYLFGWHVHEKAVMLMIFPMGILSLRSPRYIRYFLFLSIIGSFSLFPLIFHPQENVIQSLLLLCWGIIGYSGQSCSVFYLFRSIEFMNYVVLGFLYFYWSFLHTWIFGDSFEFLPLMLISVACSIGMISNWVLFYNEVMFRPDREVNDDY